MEKRKYIFKHNPARFEIACDKCGSEHIWWSEYKGMIWCYECKADTEGTGGIFDGPIPFEALSLIGLNLNRVNLETGRLEIAYKDEKTRKLCWSEEKSP